MLLAIAGITGIGKSYYKDKIVEKLNFEKVKILTTRAPRHSEKNFEDKIFITNEELQQLKQDGKIAYQFEYLGNIYAYTKEEIFSNKNMVFEMHYSTISDFKKIYPDICSIYLMPRDINITKDKIKQRNLQPEVENQRILEVDEHYNKIINDAQLREMFDYTLYNNYDQASENEIIDLVNKLISE